MRSTGRTLLNPVRHPLRLARLIVYSSLVAVVIFIFTSLTFTRDHQPLFYASNITDEFGLWPNTAGNAMNRTANQMRALQHYAHGRNHSVRRSPKSILLIGEFYFDFSEAQREMDADRCPIPDCTLTLDADRYRRAVDAIVILNMDERTLRRQYLPKPAHQIWIANHWESPLHNRIDTVAMSRYVNWSSSYRHDSHLVTPYGYVERRPLPAPVTSSEHSAVNYAAGKTKQVAWFASNCNDRNGRRNFVTELSRYIKVDIFGSCGALHCPRANSSICFNALKNDYKFYLSFENSNCYYYMTEKLFVNALKHNVLPVVMGARPEDYAAALPPHSYIHVDDFRSARDLADYLRRLDSNDTLYNEYFRWKTDWTVTGYSYWCRLCGLLHVADEQRYVHWYTDYSQYWDGDDGQACDARWTGHNRLRWQSWRQRND